MSHKLYNLNSDWQLISTGGVVTEIFNRTTELFEIIYSRNEPDANEKGVLLNENIFPRFTNLPIWARSKMGATLVVEKVIPSLSELNNAIHAGRGYIVTRYGTIAKAASFIFLARVGEDQLHFDRFNTDVSAGNVTIELFVNPTITLLGTPVTPDTLNDIAAIPAQTKVYGGTTVSNNGTLKHSTKALFTGTGTNANLATPSIAYGRVLKPKTDYIIKITNLDVNAPIEYSATFTFHESSGVLE